MLTPDGTSSQALCDSPARINAWSADWKLEDDRRERNWSALRQRPWNFLPLLDHVAEDSNL